MCYSVDYNNTLGQNKVDIQVYSTIEADESGKHFKGQMNLQSLSHSTASVTDESVDLTRQVSSISSYMY